jgi:adenosine kinase
MRKEYGGCAGNIAYNVSLLGDIAVPLATVGQDSSSYLDRFLNLGIDCKHLITLEDTYTAQAFITTDQANSQITIFHPGAMLQAGSIGVPENEKFDFAIIGPNDKAAMLRHSQACRKLKIPFLFDPGQALPILSGEEIRSMMNGAEATIMNHYEMSLVAEKLSVNTIDLLQYCSVLVVTDAERGSIVYQGSVQTHIPTMKVEKAIDPTGCGDAYRAGVLFGLVRGWSWIDAARLGSVMGAIKVQYKGGQNHFVKRQEIKEIFHRLFGFDANF